jgi:uncharacterized protein
VLKEPFDSEHGFALLPEPTPDDLFLDFEGSHFAEQGVQEYLIGYAARGAGGALEYTPLWARTLRGGVLVDLHSVVRRSLVASVERYSIKDLEPFFGYEREQDLREAAASGRLVEHALEAGELDAAFDDHFRIVERYNREDCESTARLRDWLEPLRAEVVAAGYAVPRPEPEDGEASEAITELDAELKRLRDGLLEGVPLESAERSPEQQAKFVFAHMME